MLVFMSVMAGVRLLPNSRVTYYQSDYMSYVQHIGRFQYRNESFDWRYWDSSTRKGSRDFEDYQKSGKELRSLAAKENRSVSDVFGKWVLQDMLDHPVMVVKQFIIRCITGSFLQINSINPERVGGSKIRIA